ncbi:MAG: hypothetical protein KF693_11315 [Nitrospira sp.]|nr:hypothetical protein [Nitrospira sp.]
MAAIEVDPSQAQIQAALDRGKNAADRHQPPETWYARFGGGDDLDAGGFLVTKIGALSVMATHMALRGLEPSSADVALVMESPTMLVSAVIFGNDPSFAMDSYMVLDQGGKTVKPAMVRFDGRADRSAVWPERPRFKAKVVASFTYADFDPSAKTTIIVYPARGGEVSFSLDFARIE